MAKARIAMALMLGITMFASMPAQAASKTATYETSGFFFKDSVPLPAGITSDDSLDVGGVTFSPIGGTGSTTVNINIIDAVMAPDPISFFACQDLDDDSTCGESTGDPTNPLQTVDEPSVFGCASPTKSVALASARRSAETIVFIDAAFPCDDLLDVRFATTGTIKLTF